MKRTLFLTLLICIFMTELFAQPTKIKSPELFKNYKQFPQRTNLASGEIYLLMEDLEQEWENSNWVDKYRTSNQYDAFNNNTTSLTEVLESSAWVNDSKYLLNYDGNGNITEVIVQSWENMEWVNFDREIYAYDNENRMIESIYQLWDGSDWMNSDRILYTYDGPTLSEELHQLWEDIWVNETIYTYSYDGNNNQIGRLTQQWIDEKWENDQQVAVEFNGHLITQEFYEMWVDTAWSNMGLRKIQYDGNNNRTQDTWQYWHSLYGWVDQTRWTLTYTQNNQLYEWITELSVPNEGWSYISKLTYSYDQYSNLVHWLWEDWEESGWINHVQVLSTYAPATWLEKRISSLSEFSLSQNYPNPFNPVTTIRWNLPSGSNITLKVYDILGNEVATLVDEYKPAGSHEFEFNPASFNNLSSGIYYYQLRTDHFVQSKQMLLVK